MRIETKIQKLNKLRKDAIVHLLHDLSREAVHRYDVGSMTGVAPIEEIEMRKKIWRQHFRFAVQALTACKLTDAELDAIEQKLWN